MAAKSPEASCISPAAATRQAPATAQRLARHSDINLTPGTYTRLDAQDLMAALRSLPGLSLTRERCPDSQSPTDDSDETQRGMDPRLGGVVAAWPKLAEHVRQAILALVAIGAESDK